MNTSLADQIKKLRDGETQESASSALLRPPPTPVIQGGYTSDIAASYDTLFAGSSAIRDILEPVAAVGLTGILFPGSFALVVPHSRRQVLVEFANQNANVQQWVGGAAALQTTAVQLPPEVIVLYPGDVVPLGRVSTAGVSVYVSPGRFSFQVAAASRLRSEPYVRIFRAAENLPTSIGYRLLPLWARVGSALGAAPADAAAPACQLPPECTHVRIMFQDNVSSVTGIVGGEVGSYEVYWHDLSGLVLHHEDDDFDAAGRGQASLAHNAEVYAVSPGVIGVSVVGPTAGSTFFWNLHAFTTGKGR